MGKTGFSLVLALALVTLSTSSDRECILSGSWKNDEGSNLIIFDMNNAGQFSGLYLSKQSDTPNPIVESPLNGAQHRENSEQPTFGFTVSWKFANSTAVFVGQCFVDDDGEQTLNTVWLLREKASIIEDDWKATTVGTDVFNRVE